MQTKAFGRLLSSLAAVLLLFVFVSGLWASERDVLLLGLGDFTAGDVQSIEDPSNVMKPFYKKLARSAAGQPGAITRICHIGDSLVEMDLISAEARRSLQKRFGDAGHGFVRVSWSKPWYRHRNVFMKLSSQWINHETWKTRSPGPSNLFGLGGPISIAYTEGATAQYGTLRGPIGNKLSNLELLVLQGPEGGSVAIEASGKKLAFDLSSDTYQSAVARVEVPEGSARFTVRALNKNTRVFGVVLENDGPGVVYDAIGINGFSAATLSQIDRTHFKAQLAHRSPDLVIVGLGVNDTRNGILNEEEYYHTVKRVVRIIQSTLPDCVVLLMGPLDRAIRGPKGFISDPAISRIEAVQRRVASETGAAYWSAYEAMGGEGSMEHWYNARPKLAASDRLHPTDKGADILGKNFAHSLIHELIQYMKLNEIPEPKTETTLGKLHYIAPKSD